MKNFSELNISEKILKSITQMSFIESTLIQEKAITCVCSGKDTIILSGTGSGKTLAFGIPLIDKVDPEIRKPQLLVICPTRELVVQVADELKKISKFIKGIQIYSVFGGQPIRRQIVGLKDKPNVIVATPGRLLDHIRRKTIRLESANMLVLDEADEMLKMGFREDIESISKKLAGNRQTVLASATMNKDVGQLINRFLKNPEVVDAGTANSPAKEVYQEYILVKKENKKKLLIDLLHKTDGTALVFSNTKRNTSILYNLLIKNNMKAKEIHGDMRQTERTKALKSFKNNSSNILVATDVAARGLDINNIGLVINYDFPAMQEYYIHRIGRTGRAGKDGKSITFITDSEDLQNIIQLSNKLKFKITKSDLSDNFEMKNTKKHSFRNKNYKRNRVKK